jgi:hypothetical protein
MMRSSNNPGHSQPGRDDIKPANFRSVGTAERHAPAPETNRRTGGRAWRKLGGGALSVSLLVHAIFILLAIFFFIRWVEPPPKKIDFIPGGGGGGSSGSKVTHKIQQAARQRMTPTTVSKRIASTSLSAEFSLPDSASELPDVTMPMEMGSASAGKGGGAGGGSGTGIGSGAGIGTGPGSGPGVGRGFIDPNPFGLKGGPALWGHSMISSATRTGRTPG